jgi:hypothetical protein
MLPVEKDTVRHGALAADIANLVTLGGINRDYVQGQAVLAVKRFELLCDAVADKVKNAGLAKILRKGPQISLAGEVSAVTIAQNNVNGMPLRHGSQFT